MLTLFLPSPFCSALQCLFAGMFAYVVFVEAEPIHSELLPTWKSTKWLEKAVCLCLDDGTMALMISFNN
jgi:hypothetical protein